MHSLTGDCDAFLDEEKIAVVVQVTSVEIKVTGSKAIFAQVFLLFADMSFEKTGKVGTRVNCKKFR